MMTKGLKMEIKMCRQMIFFIGLIACQGPVISGCSDENNDDPADSDAETDSDTDSDNDSDNDSNTDTDTDSDTDVYECPDNPNCSEEYCEQVLIPGGNRTMGSDEAPEDPLGNYFGQGDSRPSHLVYLDTYCVDKYEVTYERYLACVNAGVCDPNGHTWADTYVVEGHPVVINHYPKECEGDGSNIGLCWHHPVNCRDQEQSEQYCNWVGRTLCTEAQWERAANGPGSTITYPWGNAYPNSLMANLPPWSNQITANVYDYPEDVSPEGVRGMGGNVVEWVSNFYGLYEPDPDSNALSNPQGPPSGNYSSARGGCYFEGTFSNVHRHSFHPEFDWG
jgi:formylglycine-generating enzyme required for sulfatase activity